MHTPVIAFSDKGISNTRDSPYFFNSPAVVLKIAFGSGTPGQGYAGGALIGSGGSRYGSGGGGAGNVGLNGIETGGGYSQSEVLCARSQANTNSVIASANATRCKTAGTIGRLPPKSSQSNATIN